MNVYELVFESVYGVVYDGEVLRQVVPVTSYNEIIAGIVSALNEIPGVGLVDNTAGGPSPWTLNGGVPDFHWWSEVVKTRQKITTVPGAAGVMRARRTALVVIEGWYPIITAANSARTWREKRDAVLAKLAQKRFLGLRTGLMLDGEPLLAADGEAMKTSLHQGDTPLACHYAKIAARYSHEYQFTTV